MKEFKPGIYRSRVTHWFYLAKYQYTDEAVICHRIFPVFETDFYIKDKLSQAIYIPHLIEYTEPLFYE